MTALQIVQKFYPRVQSVKDATRPITVEVMPRDIDNRKAKSHKACAFAAACKRSKEIDAAIISVGIAYLIKDGKALRYSIPESLTREIVAFDRHGSFEPGHYHLTTPRVKLGAQSARGSDTRSGKGRRVKYPHTTQDIRSMQAVG